MSVLKYFGVTMDTSKAELTKIYRDRLKTAHPDMGGNATDFIKLQNAYAKAFKMLYTCPLCKDKGCIKGKPDKICECRRRKNVRR